VGGVSRDEYPRGIEGLGTQIWELVATMPRIEDAHPNFLAQLLVPPPPPPTGGMLAPQPLAIAGYCSESSNLVTGPVRRDDEE